MNRSGSLPSIVFFCPTFFCPTSFCLSSSAFSLAERFPIIDIETYQPAENAVANLCEAGWGEVGGGFPKKSRNSPLA